MRESGCRLTVFVFQIMTVGTTAMRRAVVTRAPALSSNATVAAASQITGPVMEIMTVETTVTRPTQTALIRVSILCTYLVMDHLLIVKCPDGFRKILAAVDYLLHEGNESKSLYN